METMCPRTESRPILVMALWKNKYGQDSDLIVGWIGPEKNTNRILPAVNNL